MIDVDAGVDDGDVQIHGATAIPGSRAAAIPVDAVYSRREDLPARRRCTGSGNVTVVFAVCSRRDHLPAHGGFTGCENLAVFGHEEHV